MNEKTQLSLIELLVDFFDFEQHVSGFVNGLSRVGVQDLLDTVGMGEEIWMVRSDLVVQRTNKEHMILVFHGKTSTAQSLLTINFGSSVASCFNSQFEVRQSPPRQNRTARVHDVGIIDHVRFVNANQISVSLRHGFRALAQLLDALDLFGFLIFIRKGNCSIGICRYCGAGIGSIDISQVHLLHQVR